jgi:predicted RNA binding protein YcfA (HicA-like mRNA interferase family)
MPKKIRELIAMLNKAGFVDRGGKGSHRNFIHDTGIKVTLSGASGDDALPYQEKEVMQCIEVANNETE